MARRARAALALGLVWSAAAHAELSRIETSVSADLTYTNNAQLSGAGSSDFVLDVRPRISMASRGGRLTGRFDYALDGVTHSQSGVGSKVYNTLNLDGTLEAVERFLFVDARASVSGENLSVFGPVAPGNTSASANRAEVRSLTVSPYITGRAGNWGAYSLRLDWSTLSADQSLARTSTQRLNGSLASNTEGAMVSWSLSADSTVNQYSDRDDLRNDVLRARVNFAPTPQVTVFGTVGREGYNYLPGESSRTMGGGGVVWTPDTRTRVSMERESRFFGSSYNASVSHRTQLSALSVSASRDLSSSTQQVFAAGPGNLVQNLFDLYTPRIADPFERLLAVLDFLVKAGLPPFLTRPFAFYTEQPFVDRRVQGSAVLLGARNTLGVSAYRSQREAQATGFALVDDFAFGRRIETRGAALDLSHKLSAISTLNAGYTLGRSRALDGTANTRSRLLNLSWSMTLSPRTTVSASARNNRGDGTSSYRENAVVAGVQMLF